MSGGKKKATETKPKKPSKYDIEVSIDATFEELLKASFVAFPKKKEKQFKAV